MSKSRYNLPGYGYITYQLYPHTKVVYDLLDYYGHIKRFQNVNQLGSLRNVFEGAHHTRWEYVISQLAIITELCSLSGSKDLPVGLSAPNNSFGSLKGYSTSKDPSNGELLQILVLLSNLGHLPGTFATERAFLHKLRQNSSFRSSFRAGLPKAFRQGLDQVIHDFSVYLISYYISSFYIERFRSKRGSHKVVDMCQRILAAYLKEDEEFSPHIHLFRSIRRFAYLSLDSLYTPVPFSLDLGSIFLSLETYLKDVFEYDSVFQGAMKGLEDVMRDSIYLAPSSLIKISEVSDSFIVGLERSDVAISTIEGIKKTFGPNSKWNVGFFESVLDTKEASSEGQIVKLTFDSNSDQSIDLIDDTVEWEKQKTKKVGVRSCRFAAERDPTGRHLGVAVKCTSPDPIKAFQIARELTGLMVRANANPVVASRMWANGQRLMSFLMGAIFGMQYEYRFSVHFPVPLVSKGESVIPVYIGDGTTKCSMSIGEYHDAGREYFREYAHDHSASILNEIEAMHRVMEAFSHRGRVISYWGNTYVVEPEGDRIAEFDGLAFVLATRPDRCKALFIEAKKTSGNNSQARGELEDRLSRLSVPEESYEISDIGNIGVYACAEPAESSPTGDPHA